MQTWPSTDLIFHYNLQRSCGWSTVSAPAIGASGSHTRNMVAQATSVAVISETCIRDPKGGLQGFASHFDLSASVVLQFIA